MDDEVTGGMKVTDRSGFSMIEVLVAATILVVIVMMLGALFQQTSTAWRTGLMRTGGYAQLRTYVGTIQRDATAMINANLLPKKLLYGGQEQEFNSDRIGFYTLAGADDSRALNYIEYTQQGNRKQWVLKLEQSGSSGNAQWEQVGNSGGTELLKFLPNQDDTTLLVEPRGFRFKVADGTEHDRDGNSVPNNRKFPLHLTIDAGVKQKGSLYDIGAESAGPDGQWGTKDDIRTFVDQ